MAIKNLNDQIMAFKTEDMKTKSESAINNSVKTKF